ncbi:MAG: glycosyltransferase family 2 protein [Patescibacteria group bacterium]|nr:glycosyltransferase family 2 protein [Patescibacteria group bacterium]
MDISLIIPAYNEEDYIGACIDSALKNGRGKFKEIIVVDNASTDKTAEVASRYPEVTVVVEKRKGTGNARQAGAEAATGSILAYIDADATIPEGWVEYIESTFQRDPKVVFLSGAYLYHESERYPTWLLDAIWWTTPPVYWVVGYIGNAGNCAMRADALKKAGGHDRSLAFYGDDTDLARRMHAVGKTLWRMRFNNYSSARRFDQEGIVQMCLKYMINYWWPVLFHRPFTPGHHDLKKP